MHALALLPPLFLTLPTFVLSVPFAPSLTIKSIAVPPSDWIQYGTAPPEHPITLRFALRHGDFPSLERRLLDISNPLSPRWRQHLTKQEAQDLIRPTNATLTTVDSFLSSYGIDMRAIRRSPAMDWLTLNVTVAKAEAILNTSYRLFRNNASGKTLIRCMNYSLPLHLHDNIDTIQPTTYFGNVGLPNKVLEPVAAKERFLSNSNSPCGSISRHRGACGSGVKGRSSTATRPKLQHRNATDTSAVTPMLLKSVYRFDDYTPSSNRNVLGIMSFLENYVNFNDMKVFYELYSPEAINNTITVESVNGGLNPQSPGSGTQEGDLDVEYASALVFPTKTAVFSTAGQGPSPGWTEPYDVLLSYLLSKGDDELPHTISISYADEEFVVPVDYATRVCVMFAALGVRGVSVLQASGDYGVGGTRATTCDETGNKFIPTFPGTCPYVTVVGGSSSWPEVAAYFSGGGFSNYFSQPSYQVSAVSRYLNYLNGSLEGLYNKEGRAYPDLAALSENFQFVVNDTIAELLGTSASTPTVAAIISNLNDVLLLRNSTSLGFLNPLIYGLQGRGFNDITQGSNPACGTGGFNAITGWDPVTGWGSPDFRDLRSILLNMHSEVRPTETVVSIQPSITRLGSGEMRSTIRPWEDFRINLGMVTYVLTIFITSGIFMWV